jgi:hypothetical protein
VDEAPVPDAGSTKGAFSSEVGIGSREESASKRKFCRQEAILDRRSFLVCCRGLLAMKAVSVARSAWRMPLFRLRA